jgi:hypothetical protein
VIVVFHFMQVQRARHSLHKQKNKQTNKQSTSNHAINYLLLSSLLLNGLVFFSVFYHMCFGFDEQHLKEATAWPEICIDRKKKVLTFVF